MIANGIPARVKASWTSRDWKCARYKTAMAFRSMPSSRNSRIRWATNAACWLLS